MRRQSLSGADADRSFWAQEAPTAWSEALAILDRLHHPGVSLVRTKFWPSLPVPTNEYENTWLLAAVEGLRKVRDPNTIPAAKTQRLRSIKGEAAITTQISSQRSGPAERMRHLSLIVTDPRSRRDRANSLP